MARRTKIYVEKELITFSDKRSLTGNFNLNMNKEKGKDWDYAWRL